MELTAHIAWIPGSASWQKKFEDFVRDAEKAKCLALGEEKKNLLSNWAARIRMVKIPADIGRIRKDPNAETAILPLVLHGQNKKWTSEEADPLSGSGKAAKLHTGHAQWAVQARLLPLDRYGTGKWDICARVRVKTGKELAPETKLFAAGCQNEPKLPPQIIRRKQLPENEYAFVQLAKGIVPTEKSYVWFSPLNNPDQVEAVYIDSVIAVRSAKGK